MRYLRTPTWAPGARCAFAAVALASFGLLSMHGWGSHVSAHSLGVTPQAADATVTSGHTGTHATAPRADGGRATAEQNRADRHAAFDSEEPDGEGGPGMVGLCLAVLAGLLLGIALLLARRGLRIPRTLQPVWQHPAFIGRDRDPPDLRELCVIRC